MQRAAGSTSYPNVIRMLTLPCPYLTAKPQPPGKHCGKCERFSEGSLSKGICVFSGKNTCHGFVRRGCTPSIVVSKCGITKCAALEFMISPCFYELGQN